MALRKASNEKREGLAPPGAPSSGGAPEMGTQVEECVALGQALVESGQAGAIVGRRQG
jgi:hypothetical protein